MSGDDNTVQSSFNDTQSFDINVDQMYQDFIVNIDNHRSYVSATNFPIATILQPCNGMLTPATVYQESRLHAFYRMVGFPVLASDNRFYNPGLDIIKDPTRKLTLKEKVSIASTPITGFEKFSQAREAFPIGTAKLFSQSQTIEAATTSLSGGANAKGIRKFADTFKVDDPLDVKPSNQSNPVQLNSKVGEFDIQLSDYQDADGKKPSGIGGNRQHLIKPFIVDPRIDFTVSPLTDSKSTPKSRRIGIPFVPDQRFLKVSTNAWAEAPLLETVITDRFKTKNQAASSGTSTQSLIDFVNNVPALVSDKDLISQISSDDITSTSQVAKFKETINTIRALMKKLVDAQHKIQEVQSAYYWVPVPSNIGPEGGCTIQGVFLPTVIDPKLVTDKDKAILFKSAQSLLSASQQNPAVADATGDPDSSGSAKLFSFFMGPRSSISYTDIAATTLSTLTKSRNATLKEGSDALRIIEIITGEFSGFGLVDFVAIMGALYVMPDNSLLGFLDTDAFNRMEKKLKTGVSPSSLNIQTSLTSLGTYVKQFYTIMDDVYKDLAVSNGLITSQT